MPILILCSFLSLSLSDSPPGAGGSYLMALSLSTFVLSPPTTTSRPTRHHTLSPSLASIVPNHSHSQTIPMEQPEGPHLASSSQPLPAARRLELGLLGMACRADPISCLLPGTSPASCLPFHLRAFLPLSPGELPQS